MNLTSFFCLHTISVGSTAYQSCLLLCRNYQRSWGEGSYILKGERRDRNLRPGKKEQGMCTWKQKPWKLRYTWGSVSLPPLLWDFWLQGRCQSSLALPTVHTFCPHDPWVSPPGPTPQHPELQALGVLPELSLHLPARTSSCSSETALPLPSPHLTTGPATPWGPNSNVLLSLFPSFSPRLL